VGGAKKEVESKHWQTEFDVFEQRKKSGEVREILVVARRMKCVRSVMEERQGSVPNVEDLSNDSTGNTCCCWSRPVLLLSKEIQRIHPHRCNVYYSSYSHSSPTTSSQVIPAHPVHP